MDEEKQEVIHVSNAVFCMILGTLLVVYFGSERSVLHVSRNLRRVYFLLCVGLVSYWLLTVVKNAGGFLIFCSMTAVMLFASVVEDKMERAIYLTPFSSRSLEDVVETPEARGKSELLQSIMERMSRWQGFSVGLAKQLAWLDGSLHRHQAAIHQVLEGANKEELNFILAHNNATTLLEVAADKTVDLLASKKGRLRDLTTLSRAVLLDGFQKIGLRHRPLRQAYAHKILMSTHAEDLSELKSYLDDGPDYHTTFKLLYSDFQGELQQEVLEHVSVEGHRALAHFRKKHPNIPGMTLKVVSDIDDTLMCSGGHFPAGSDLRFPRSCVYPGVLAFYRGLDHAFASRIKEQEDLTGGSPRASDPQVASDSLVRAYLRRGASHGDYRRGASPRALHRVSPGGDGSPSPTCRHLHPLDSHGLESSFSDSGSRLTVHNLRRKNSVEDSLSRPAGASNEGEPSGNLESIAESSWDAESEADSMPYPPYPQLRTRRSDGGASTISSLSEALRESRAGEDSSQRQRQGHEGDARGPGGAATQDTSLQSIAESNRWEGESEADSSLSVRIGQRDGVGTSAGAAISAVMPSASSMQQMVGLTMLAGLPSAVADPLAGPAHGKPRASGDKQDDVFEPQQSSGHLVFLSARPESYKGFTEGLSFKRIFEPLVRRGDLQGYPVLLLGSMRVGPTALYAYAADRRGAVGPASMHFYKALAEKKLSRFRQFAAIYPECCWVFCGDNGQGDVILAENLVKLLGTKLVASFLNQVVPLSETATRMRKGQVRVSEQTTARWPKAWRDQKIFLASDYISLAAEAHKQKLMDALALRAVAIEASNDLRRVSARHAHSAFEFDQDLVFSQLNSGIAAANALLPDHLKVEPLPVPQSLLGDGRTKSTRR